MDDFNVLCNFLIGFIAGYNSFGYEISSKLLKLALQNEEVARFICYIIDDVGLLDLLEE